ncbi:MAG: sodium ion-translocating decarboxylase subunit beta [Oscillospiraceae bacterium]|jgi:oxaloacetate decarboxylase beta subunit|nr:sodium ion-translocating decarboxylase subunit beta [Oscillospiraceae bacterium]
MNVFNQIGETLKGLWEASAFTAFSLDNLWWVMIIISFVLIYLAVVKGFEPLLLLPIAFGMCLTNLPGSGMFHPEFFMYTEPVEGIAHSAAWYVDTGHVLHEGGFLDILYMGVKLQVFPPLIFLGIGCMTDFGPLIARPSSFLLGAAAQIGIFATFILACLVSLFGIDAIKFTLEEASSIAIIGGADGPTAIWLTNKLAPHMLGSIAVAAYSYMALVPLIQPPIMRALTTKKERLVKMEQLRPVSKREKILFPIFVTVIVAAIIPDATPLVGCLMLGNLFKESGVVDRLVKTASNELMNIVVIMLGLTVGATATASNFLSPKTLVVVCLGLIAFCIGTASGVLFGKLMCLFTGGKINPLIGSAGVSAVPMAARVSQKVGQEFNPNNYLLMHAMGPNVAGVIGSAVAAGVLYQIFG